MDDLREGKHICMGNLRSECQILGTLHVVLDKLLFN